MDTHTLIHRITMALANRRSVIESARPHWQWRPGFRVILAPDIKCPICLKVYRSWTVWVISRTRILEVRVYDEGKRRFRVVRLQHPHADSSGNICFGSAQGEDAFSILFLGINRAGMYCTDGGLQEWLYEVIPHECEKPVEEVEPEATPTVPVADETAQEADALAGVREELNQLSVPLMGGPALVGPPLSTTNITTGLHLSRVR